MDGPPIIEEQTFEVRDGELVGSESWVYVWRRPAATGEVVYVGATGLPPPARFWLHLHHDDPRLGRVRAEHPEALAGEVMVSAFRLHPSLEGRFVKGAEVALLEDEQVD
ncbi:MAG: hypothetical protein GY788_12095, partial [bacterium]|nr:hypothetical protein [bacterium]